MTVAIPESSMRLLAAVLANPGLCLSHAARHADLTKEQAHERARALVRDKLLTRTGKPRKPAFTLTPKARKIVAAYAKTAKRCPACGATE